MVAAQIPMTRSAQEVGGRAGQGVVDRYRDAADQLGVPVDPAEQMVGDLDLDDGPAGDTAHGLVASVEGWTCTSSGIDAPPRSGRTKVRLEHGSALPRPAGCSGRSQRHAAAPCGQPTRPPPSGSPKVTEPADEGLPQRLNRTDGTVTSVSIPETGQLGETHSGKPGSLPHLPELIGEVLPGGLCGRGRRRWHRFAYKPTITRPRPIFGEVWRLTSAVASRVDDTPPGDVRPEALPPWALPFRGQQRVDASAAASPLPVAWGGHGGGRPRAVSQGPCPWRGGRRGDTTPSESG
jgi:hypothetical protein